MEVLPYVPINAEEMWRDVCKLRQEPSSSPCSRFVINGLGWWRCRVPIYICADNHYSPCTDLSGLGSSNHQSVFIKSCGEMNERGEMKCWIDIVHVLISIISAYKPFQLHDTFINMDPKLKLLIPPPPPPLPPSPTSLYLSVLSPILSKMVKYNWNHCIFDA